MLKLSLESFAELVGLAAEELRDLERGRVSLSMDDTERLLNAAGLQQHARLEVYEEHDDGLHLAAMADPDRTLRQLAQFGPRFQ